ncbi:hypothetical protein N9329_01730 [Gammaproteobacteria bacterium]|jgi:hypothetical protein|nr:hypothetical protein [Gammaproteobacteria bacterium]
MFADNYKKMAGTSAVFLSADYNGASPVERDGVFWSAEELHLNAPLTARQDKPPMHNALALEGLEDYDAPEDGDVRAVASIGSEFVYLNSIRAWVQMV